MAKASQRCVQELDVPPGLFTNTQAKLYRPLLHLCDSANLPAQWGHPKLPTAFHFWQARVCDMRCENKRIDPELSMRLQEWLSRDGLVADSRTTCDSRWMHTEPLKKRWLLLGKMRRLKSVCQTEGLKQPSKSKQACKDTRVNSEGFERWFAVGFSCGQVLCVFQGCFRSWMARAEGV